LAVGPSLLRALWHGMRCLTMSEIRRWDATHFSVSSRHFCSRSTSFPSALEVFHDYALYKFTIDIDIDIDIVTGIFQTILTCRDGLILKPRNLPVTRVRSGKSAQWNLGLIHRQLSLLDSQVYD